MMNNKKIKLLLHERIVLSSPNSNSAIAVTLKGFIDEEKLKNALENVFQKYPILCSSILIDEKHEVWFVKEKINKLPLTILKRETKDHWIQEYLKEQIFPFDLEKGPLIKFILLKSNEMSNLIIICHDLICDGMSLSYLLHNIVNNLNSKNEQTEEGIYKGVKLKKEIFPKNVSDKIILKYFWKIINEKWQKNEVMLNYTDFKKIHKIFWNNYHYNVVINEFSKEEISGLILNCREKNLKLTSALSTAFLLAYEEVMENKNNIKLNHKLDITINLREHLNKKIGFSFGNYGGKITLKFKYNTRKKFWQNAKKIQKILNEKLSKKEEFNILLYISYINPILMDSLPVILLDNIEKSNNKKFAEIKKKNIVNLAYRHIQKKQSKVYISNFGRNDFLDQDRLVKIERIYALHSPSTSIDMMIGVQTINGKMSLTINHMEEVIDTLTVKKILKRAIFLLKNI